LRESDIRAAKSASLQQRCHQRCQIGAGLLCQRLIGRLRKRASGGAGIQKRAGSVAR